jgi:hypothetical protein
MDLNQDIILPSLPSNFLLSKIDLKLFWKFSI